MHPSELRAAHRASPHAMAVVPARLVDGGRLLQLAAVSVRQVANRLAGPVQAAAAAVPGSPLAAAVAELERAFTTAVVSEAELLAAAGVAVAAGADRYDEVERRIMRSRS